MQCTDSSVSPLVLESFGSLDAPSGRCRPVPAAGPSGRLLNLQHRLGIGPVLLKLIVVALGYGEDVDDDHAEVEQRPVRVGPALAPNRPYAFTSQLVGDAVGDGAQLALS